MDAEMVDYCLYWAGRMFDKAAAEPRPELAQRWRDIAAGFLAVARRHSAGLVGQAGRVKSIA